MFLSPSGQRELNELAKLADNYDVRKLANVILENPKFPIWSGSSKPEQHHYGKGCLLIHTLEVVELCLLNNDYFVKLGKSVDGKQLFLAALFHDIGKTWDYVPTDKEYKEWTGSNHKRSIHHVSRSGLVWYEAAAGIEYRDNAILSHHGRREWGSPVSPVTRMAWILHLSDSISARMDDVYKSDRSKS